LAYLENGFPAKERHLKHKKSLWKMPKKPPDRLKINRKGSDETQVARLGETHHFDHGFRLYQGVTRA
jgi:hypothetical protein